MISSTAGVSPEQEFRLRTDSTSDEVLPAAGAAAGPVAVPGAGTVRTAVQRWSRGETSLATDEVVEELPVALVYHGVPHVVMLATPRDLEDYGVGFTLSEGLVAHRDEIRAVEAALGPESAEVRISVAWDRFAGLLRRRRNLAGRSGCGLCGSETLEQAVRTVAPVGEGPRVPAVELHAVLEELECRQPLNARTGSVHAAAWVLPGRGIEYVREDVGRHNALDKVIGALARSGADFQAGYLLVTSRASFEMVQKAAAVGVSFVAAVSAPTSLAIRMAERCGVTLVGFARRDRHVTYANPHRLS